MRGLKFKTFLLVEIKKPLQVSFILRKIRPKALKKKKKMDRMHFSLHGMKNIVPWNFN